jgi:hypothetical protein
VEAYLMGQIAQPKQMVLSLATRAFVAWPGRQHPPGGHIRGFGPG